MKPGFNRMVSLCLAAVLTVLIALQTLRVADHMQTARALAAQAYPKGFAESAFSDRREDLQDLVDASGLSEDAGFTEQVAELFTQLYRALADLITGRASFADADFTARMRDIFDGLFAIDTRVHEQAADPDDLQSDGFVAFAASIIWDFMDYYDTKRLSEQEMTEGVSVIKDIPYIENADVYRRLDIYAPEGNTKDLPVIIDIHGGGLMYGEKELNRIYASRLASRGYIVIVINYRLCPDVLYPDQVRDVMAAYRWVAQNGASYRCDLNNVYVVGDSAGGQLAFYTSIVNTSETLRALYETPETGLTLNAAGLISGMYDMKSGFNSPLISCMLGCAYEQSPYYPYLQPEEVIDLGTLPPSYIVTSAKDFLRPASVQLDALLTEKGVEHQFHDWELTLNRSSGHITSVAYPDLPESQTTTDEMLAFFEAHRR